MSLLLFKVFRFILAVKVIVLNIFYLFIGTRAVLDINSGMVQNVSIGQLDGDHRSCSGGLLSADVRAASSSWLHVILVYLV